MSKESYRITCCCLRLEQVLEKIVSGLALETPVFQVGTAPREHRTPEEDPSVRSPGLYLPSTVEQTYRYKRRSLPVSTMTQSGWCHVPFNHVQKYESCQKKKMQWLKNS